MGESALVAGSLDALYSLASKTARMRRECGASFLAFLRHVVIESDPEDGGTGGPIPFDLYDYQREAAERWQAMPGGTGEITLKTRQVGYSWALCSLAYWTAAYHRASHVALFSAGEEEVKKLILKVAYIHEHYPAHLRPLGRVGITNAKFEGASTITGFPATRKAGIGTTLALAGFDEAAFHAYLKENVGAVVPATGSFGKTIILSTSDPDLGEYGAFADLWRSAKGANYAVTPGGAHVYEEGASIYRAVFLPADIRPGRDAEWFAREQRKYPGDLDRYHAFYPASAAQAFVGRAGLVFPEFREDLHVVQAHPKAWADYDYRIASIDPGGTDPTAIVPNGVFKTPIGYSFHQPYEFYRRGGVTTEAIINWLAVLDREAPFDLIWIDIAGGAVLLETLRQYFGDRVYPAIKDREAGIQAYRQCLGERRLTHHASCKETIKEYYGYRIGERRDPHDQTLYVTKTPVDHHADAKDAQRYNILGFNQVLGTSVSSGPWKLAWR